MVSRMNEFDDETAAPVMGYVGVAYGFIKVHTSAIDEQDGTFHYTMPDSVVDYMMLRVLMFVDLYFYTPIFLKLKDFRGEYARTSCPSIKITSLLA